MFRLLVTGVKAPVALNVWIVLPPDDVTRPPLNACEPAYEMITVPLPPAPPAPAEALALEGFETFTNYNHAWLGMKSR